MERLGEAWPEDRQQRGVRKAREQYWPGTLMAVGLFLFLFTFWAGQLVTFITFTELFRALAFFCMAGNLLPYVRSGLALGMERLEWFLFNLLALGPLVFTALFWTNYLVHDPPRTILLSGNYSRQEVLAHWRASGSFPPGRPLERVGELLTPEERMKGYVIAPVLGVARGLLGYDVIVEWNTATLVHVRPSARR